MGRSPACKPLVVISKMPIKTIEIDTLEKYLDYLRQRPLMHLCRKEIDLLEANINGYLMARALQNDFLMQFNEFVSCQYDCDGNAEGWRTLILRKLKGNQFEAFEEFFRLYDLYKKSIKA